MVCGEYEAYLILMIFLKEIINNDYFAVLN